MSGLRDTIKYNVVVKNPITMMEAMRLARVEEEKLLNQKKGSKFYFQKGGAVPSAIGGSSNTKSHTTSSSHNSPSIVQRLTPQELREKRDNSTAMRSTSLVTSVKIKKIFVWT